MRRLSWMMAATALALVGCGQAEEVPESVLEENAALPDATDPADAPKRAVATLLTADGAEAGTATATVAADGILLTLRVRGLPEGERGAHIHMVGRCDTPDFASAGGHWNPDDKSHGLENPEGPHAGDMPNLVVEPGGRGMLDYTLTGGDLDSMLDADGAAMVIHAKVDDQKTDPSGNSGDRIACGVFELK